MASSDDATSYITLPTTQPLLAENSATGGEDVDPTPGMTLGGKNIEFQFSCSFIYSTFFLFLIYSVAQWSTPANLIHLVTRPPSHLQKNIIPSLSCLYSEIIA